MKDLIINGINVGAIISEWEIAADSDGVPPRLSPEEQTAVATAHLQAESALEETRRQRHTEQHVWERQQQLENLATQVVLTHTVLFESIFVEHSAPGGLDIPYDQIDNLTDDLIQQVNAQLKAEQQPATRSPHRWSVKALLKH